MTEHSNYLNWRAWAYYGTMPLVLAGVVIAIYSLAWSGSWHYDDFPSLSGLDNVNGLITAIGYATEGIAGPLGRPIALLSFAVQAESWPEDPRAFLVANTIIHAVNAVVVFLVALALGRFVAPDSRKLPWFALSVAAIWSLSPFLASSTLMPVQRMTTLSASFLFAGLFAYLHGRWMMAEKPRAGLLVALTGLAGGTFLAVLTKESGALLPVLALVCEVIVVGNSHRQGQRIPRMPKHWMALALLLPTLLILGYLAMRGLSASGYDRRGFDLAERLWTQSRVIWDYVVHLLVPRTDSVTPYMDGYPISRGWLDPISTVVAVAGLFLAVIVGILSIRRLPLLAFGIGWFMAGHLLESTVIPLELYFAHRNYVPAFGLYVALIYPVFFSKTSLVDPRLAIAGLWAYILAMGAVLASTTSLWGQPDLAAEMWYRNNPDSTRATQAISQVYRQQGDPIGANQMLERGLEKNPGNQMLTVQRLRYCFFGEEDLAERASDARAVLEPPRTVTLGTAVQLHNFVLEADSLFCRHTTRERLRDLIEVALRYPSRHLSKKVTVYLHHSLAHLAQTRGNFERMQLHLEYALKLDADPQTAVLIAYSLILQDDLAGAQRYLRAQIKEAPEGLIRSRVWKAQLGEYLEAISG